MELQHLVVKIPLEGALAIDPAKIVDVFHPWVAAQSLPGVVLIDVAELLHVPNGPGVIAVGVEADCAFDHTGGVWGVLHRRKNTLPGTNAENIIQAFEEATQVAIRLEEAFSGKLKFSRTDFELIVNDRGLVPNTPESYAAVMPEIEATLGRLLGHTQFKLTRHDAEKRQRFGVSVKSARALKFSALTPA
jgi:hypothetical protein